jgi:hypothetical protein
MDQKCQNELDAEFYMLQTCAVFRDRNALKKMCQVLVVVPAASCKDTLGAITTDQTGFGVVCGICFLKDWLARGN